MVFANYLPEREEGDDTNIQQHVEFLRREKHKKKPNYEKECMLKNKTLADIR